jgi:hypothetical protein
LRTGNITTFTITNVSGESSLVGYSGIVGAVNKVFGSGFNRNAIDNPFGRTGFDHNIKQVFQ